jgi:hypothetical protein
MARLHGISYPHFLPVLMAVAAKNGFKGSDSRQFCRFSARTKKIWFSSEFTFGEEPLNAG